MPPAVERGWSGGMAPVAPRSGHAEGIRRHTMPKLVPCLNRGAQDLAQER